MAKATCWPKIDAEIRKCGDGAVGDPSDWKIKGELSITDFGKGNLIGVALDMQFTLLNAASAKCFT